MQLGMVILHVLEHYTHQQLADLAATLEAAAAAAAALLLLLLPHSLCCLHHVHLHLPYICRQCLDQPHSLPLHVYAKSFRHLSINITSSEHLSCTHLSGHSRHNTMPQLACYNANRPQT